MTKLNLFVLALTLAITMLPAPASAGTLLLDRFDKLNDSTPSATALHQVGFTTNDTINPIGSISIEFCSNSPIVGDSCGIPSGLDVSGTILAAQTGETGFAVHPNTNSNRIVLTRAPSVPTGVPSTYDLDNILNPDNNGTLFLRIETFGTTDGTGLNVQEGGIAVSINEAVTINAEVPPTLIFCVAITLTAFDCSSADNYFIDFGSLQTTSTSHATSQFIAGTNAEFGYSVTVAGTTLTSGLNTITPLATPTVSSTGVSQFGLNLRENTIPNNGNDVTGPGTAAPTANYNIPNRFTFIDGDIIASVPNSTDFRKFTVNYITNIDGTEPGGVYATTLLYICLANF